MQNPMAEELKSMLSTLVKRHAEEKITKGMWHSGGGAGQSRTRPAKPEAMKT